MCNRSLRDFVKCNEKSILILGPKNVGKTTLLSSLNPDITFDLSEIKLLNMLKMDLGHFQAEISKLNAKLVFVDEIQLYPKLLDDVQYCVDHFKWRFF